MLELVRRRAKSSGAEASSPMCPHALPAERALRLPEVSEGVEHRSSDSRMLLVAVPTDIERLMEKTRLSLAWAAVLLASSSS